MSIAIAATDGVAVVMGVDSAATSGNGSSVVLSRDHAKLFHNGPCGVAYTGSLTGSAILRTLAAIALGPQGFGFVEWLEQYVVPDVFTIARERGVLEKDSEGAEQLPFSFIVTYGTEIASVGCDGGVLVPEDPFVAIGTGASAARGAMLAAGVPLYQRVSRGLSAAIRYDSSCAGPQLILLAPAGGIGEPKPDDRPFIPRYDLQGRMVVMRDIPTPLDRWFTKNAPAVISPSNPSADIDDSVGMPQPTAPSSGGA